MHSRTPTEISKQVRRVVAKVAPTQTPVFVKVDPQPGCAMDECFNNVQTVVACSGGASCIGWQIWEWPNVMIEAEFHAVWQQPDGTLIDVTPKADQEERILFLADPRRSYQGHFVDNVRIALRDDPLIADFISLSEQMFRATRTGRPGEPAVVRKDVFEPIAESLQLVTEMLERGLRAHDLCLCGSGRKYKRCHGAAR